MPWNTFPRRLVHRSYFVLLAGWLVLLAADIPAADPPGGGETSLHLPWREAGLSERRAAAVAKELEANGVKLDAVLARGDQAPSVANPERAPEAMNRRALIVIREATPN